MKRAVVALIVIATLGAGASRLLAQGVIIQQILVKVNGEIFTASELTRKQIQALQDMNKVVTSPKDLQNDATLVPVLLQITPDILVNAVDDLLIVQRAREIGYRFSDENFKNAVASIKKENKLDDAGLNAALAHERMTMEELRQNLEKEFLKSGVIQDLMQRLTLTEQEARAYYDAHPDEFMKPATVILRELLVAVPTQAAGAGKPTTFNVGSDEAAAEKIKGIRERVIKGEDFAKLVAELSDSPTKSGGGLMVPVNLTDMSQGLRDIIEKLKPGEVTEPLRLASGYELFQLESRTAAEVEAFDKVRDKISQHVFDSRRTAEMKKYLQTLRAQALIEWKHDDMKKLYEKRISELKAGAGLDAGRQ